MTILNGIKLKGNETFTELLEIGKREKIYTHCRSKNPKCNNELRPDWTSQKDPRYCLSCMPF